LWLLTKAWNLSGRYGAKAPFLSFRAACGLTEPLGEKGSDWGVLRIQLLQGLKPDIDVVAFIGPTEVRPCYKALEGDTEMSFSPSSEVRPCYKAHPKLEFVSNLKWGTQLHLCGREKPEKLSGGSGGCR
jgi:hypothetical protein